ncbi:MAG: HAD hydrolase-like protein [Gammaproteobacteria bacterium]|nr:HAD hydrolase-like protein [Gammaproteobacteria bacterium]
MRFNYTLIQSFKYRKKLALYLNPNDQLNQVSSLTATDLNNMQIKALALDFDGVLAPHGDIAPLTAIELWLKNLSNDWKGQIFILSNKPFQEREHYFKTYFPEIQFIKNVAKKPYPDGLNKITLLAQCESQEVLMIDDRLLTGMLAASISGTKGLLLNPALKKPGLHPHELFFALLRRLDRFLIGVIS